MPEYTIKSEISLLTQDAHAALQRLRQEYEDLRRRLAEPIPVGSPTGSAGSAGRAMGRTGFAAGGLGETSAALSTASSAASRASRSFSLLTGTMKGASTVFLAAKVSIGLFSGALGAAGAAARGLGSILVSAITLPLKGATLAFQGFGAAANAIRSASGVVKTLLAPAAQMQQYSISTEVLLKNTEKAKKRIAELQKYARDTNFDPQQVIEASNMMEAFGIHGDTLTRLRLAGDAANTFVKDIREVVTSLNYLGSGRGGEAFESLARIGITREKLKPYGVKFGSQGQLVSSTKKALQAVFDYFEKNFGGMTARQAKTWGGALQQLAGQVTFTLSEGFKSALQPFTDFVTQRLIPAIDDAGKALAKIDWKTTLKPALDILGAATSLAGRLANPQTRKGAVQDAKALRTSLLAAGKILLGGFGDVGTALLHDLGVVIEAAFKPGVLLNAGLGMLNVFKTIFQAGLGLFRLILAGFSDRFKSDMLVLLDKLPGVDTGETERRQSIRNQVSRDFIQDMRAGKFGDQYKNAPNAMLMQSLFSRYREKGGFLGQRSFSQIVSGQEHVDDPLLAAYQRTYRTFFESGGRLDRFNAIADAITGGNAELAGIYRKLEDAQIGSGKAPESNPWGGVANAMGDTRKSFKDAWDAFEIDPLKLKAPGALKTLAKKTLPKAYATVEEQIGNLNRKADAYNSLRSLRDNLMEDFRRRLPAKYRDIDFSEKGAFGKLSWGLMGERNAGWYGNGDERRGGSASAARRRYLQGEAALNWYRNALPRANAQEARLRQQLNIQPQGKNLPPVSRNNSSKADISKITTNTDRIANGFTVFNTRLGALNDNIGRMNGLLQQVLAEA